jgi:hypothetical protein
MITRARRHRFVISLITAYALLLSTMLPAFASLADPLQSYLGAHLCGPGESQGDNAPANSSDHQQKCQLCGPSCAMGGHAPVATLCDGLISVAPLHPAAEAPFQGYAPAPAPLSLYPSDIFSQGPPQAV